MTNTTRFLFVTMLLLGGCSSVENGSDPAQDVGDDRDTDLPGGTDPNAAYALGKADGNATLSNDIHWVRNSAEYQAATRQIYRQATARLENMLAESPRREGTWAVVLDADETVLDNSQYQKERLGRSSTTAAWRAWVQRGEAGAVPGAIAFLHRVKELGGIVAIVTNRANADCDATRTNLRELDAEFDVVLCKGRSSDKSSRWQQVEDGEADDDLGPAHILMYVGDNIQDFPEMSQSVRADADEAFEDFGDRFFVIPNPMYGSWERTRRD